MIKSEIVADSINDKGLRITSFVLTYPRFIHAEMLTHRVCSRNAASSRAIPSIKMIKSILKQTVMPKAFQKAHKGMQGNEYIGGNKLRIVTILWLLASRLAVGMAWTLTKMGVTKQITNRLLEPFQYYTALFTSTDYENFFALRAHEAAEIHIQELAYKMLEEYNNSSPKKLRAGEWHLPFGDNIDTDRLVQLWLNINQVEGYENPTQQIHLLKVKISSARCARISYMNFIGKDDYYSDIKLHDALLSSDPKHASPAEHPAQNMDNEEFFSHMRMYITKFITSRIAAETLKGITEFEEREDGTYVVKEYGWSGNFRGYIQYRKMLENENQTDSRLEKV